MGRSGQGRAVRASRWAVLALAVSAAMLVPWGGGWWAQEEVEVDARCCSSRQAAVEAMEEGIGSFLGANWRAAGESLCRAACCWPRPDASLPVRLGPAESAYLPFYWRGRYHLDSADDHLRHGDREAALDDYCRSLHDLNLSLCEGAVEEPDVRRTLRTPVGELAGRARARRPRTPGQYRQGVEALERGRPRDGALLLLESIRRWDEDGEGERIQGRWPDSYLPRHHLGRALMELGCARLAAAVLGCSQMARCQRRDRPDDPDRLLEEIRRALEEGGRETPEVCLELERRVDEAGLDLGGCCRCAGCG